MRRIMSVIMDLALEENAADNARCATLREVYPYLDSQVQMHGGNPEVSAKLAEALTVGDFPLYFNRVLSRGVYDRYASRMGQWRDYTYAETVPDYSIAERFRFSEFDRPVRRREKEEAYAGWLSETRVQLQVEDFAKQIDFSNRILVNDDLGAFNNIVVKMADSAKRFEDFYVSALYDNALANAAMTALGILYAGTGRLTTANLAIAYSAFMQRTDARGNFIQVSPVYLVIPPVLRLTARTILESDQIAELATNGKNVLQGALQVREDPYIAYAVPNIPWYLFAAPNEVPGVSVVRMQDRPGIRMFAKAPDKVPMSGTGALGTADWRNGSYLTGDIELAVETTIGCRIDAPGTFTGITDPNGVYWSSGTTP